MSKMSGTIVNKLKSRRSAFSMIELVIVVVIIGIIAAIAIPRMSRGTTAAAEVAAAQNLALLRNAIDLYHTEHVGKYPKVEGSVTVEDQLTKFSNIDGTAVSATRVEASGIIYGPYLRAVPPISVGSRKGSNGIGTADAVGIGWIYDGSLQTGVINVNATGNDSTGKAYTSY